MMRHLPVLLILLVLFLSAPAMGDGRPVVIASGSEHWAPYLMLDQGSTSPRGALYDLLNEACRAAGADCRFVEYPWKRALDNLAYGDIDIICGIYATEERRREYLFSSAIFTDEVRVFSSVSLAVETIEDLKGLRGDAMLGASYGDEVDAYAARYLDLTRIMDKRQSLERIINGDTDYVICPRRDCQATIDEMGLTDRIRMQPLILATEDVYMAFSRQSKHAPILEAINRQLNKLIKNGRALSILESYTHRQP